MSALIYIGEWRVDLQAKESVDVVSSVLDITDITKNTGDYTKTFTVPASKRNNILFKHWYDANIDNSFDARVKVEGRIEIDGLPFKLGKFRLSKVSVNKNKPENYTINFFGKLASLKDTLGKDELSELDFSAYDHDYNKTNVELGLTTGNLLSGDIVYNLFTKRRLWYNEDATDNNVENIAWVGGSDTGVRYSDLRPSIRLIKIIEAIEAEYTVANGYQNDIVFSRDFFDTSEFRGLFMWLNPDKDLSVGGETRLVNWDSGSNANVDFGTDIGTFTIEPNSRWEFDVSVVTPDLFVVTKITLSMYVGGIKTQERTGNISNGTLQFPLNMFTSITSNELETKEVYFKVKKHGNVNRNIFVTWVQRKYNASNVLLLDQSTFATAEVYGSVFNVNGQLPKIKILDFLKGIFNMFKLVVIPQDDGTLYVDTLLSYYASGKTYDVTKYIDFKSYDVNRGQILNEIELKFAEPKTILNIQFEKNNLRGYGDEEVTLKDEFGKLLDGTSLKLKIPFEQIVYERLVNLVDGLPVDLQYAAIIDEELEPVNPAPHIFYNKLTHLQGSEIAFLGNLNTDRTVINSRLNTAFHSNSPIDNTYAVIFKNEFSTWDGASLDNNLYTRHYQSYVNNIFNIKKRTFVFKAQLPIHIVTKLELNDTLRIKGNYYRIDKYSYNLLTGSTTLTLINNFDENIGEPTASDANIYSDFAAKTETTQVTNLQSTTVTKVDTGFGTGWATVTTSGNNLEIALTEFSTTNGDIRTMIIRSSGVVKNADVYVTQYDKGYIPSMDFSDPRNTQLIPLIILKS